MMRALGVESCLVTGCYVVSLISKRLHSLALFHLSFFIFCESSFSGWRAITSYIKAFQIPRLSTIGKTIEFRFSIHDLLRYVFLVQDLFTTL